MFNRICLSFIFILFFSFSFSQSVITEPQDVDSEQIDQDGTGWKVRSDWNSTRTAHAHASVSRYSKFTKLAIPYTEISELSTFSVTGKNSNNQINKGEYDLETGHGEDKNGRFEGHTTDNCYHLDKYYFWPVRWSGVSASSHVNPDDDADAGEVKVIIEGQGN